MTSLCGHAARASCAGRAGAQKGGLGRAIAKRIPSEHETRIRARFVWHIAHGAALEVASAGVFNLSAPSAGRLCGFDMAPTGLDHISAGPAFFLHRGSRWLAR